MLLCPPPVSCTSQGRVSCTRLLLAYGGLVDLAGLTQTDQGTVLGLLLEGAQRLQQGPATRERWQAAGEALLATRTEERRVLQARKRGWCTWRCRGGTPRRVGKRRTRGRGCRTGLRQVGRTPMAGAIYIEISVGTDVALCNLSEL
jgi:hypothetical protein